MDGDSSSPCHGDDDNDDSEVVSSLVIDNGSWTCKVGLAGENRPRFSFPTVVGIPEHPELMFDETRDVYIGGDAVAKRKILTVRTPVIRGIVVDWEDMERVWHHAFYTELKVAPERRPVLLTEKWRNPKANRERALQIMFEAFSVPAFYIQTAPVLALYASGRGTTGCVVDSGHERTHVVCVYRGYVIPHSAVELPWGGNHVTDTLRELLHSERGFSGEEEILVDIKERLAFVAEDYDAELTRAEQFPAEMETVYELPAGNTVLVGEEKFRCVEGWFFEPSLVGGKEETSLVKGVWKSICDAVGSSGSVKCEEECHNPNDWKRSFCGNVVLAGGNTMFPGLSNRLQRELSKSTKEDDIPFLVYSPPHNCNSQSVWIGASILASLATFQEMWISRADYKQFGPSIVHEKCC